MMGFDKVGLTIGTVIFAAVLFLMVMVAGLIGMASWEASEKDAAYKAYVGCLHEMANQPIDVKQTFCGRIRDQL